MEGAAVAQVAARNNVPALVPRRSQGHLPVPAALHLHHRSYHALLDKVSRPLTNIQKEDP